ncbi:hypothetical protein HYFRA_00011061 [Hymenoscyphus fraxineus]|uniref:SprT-like domain-containing protein n=1 Tax=Hymenoscyphus fraxineus TaxID=746836 RepID=A0A9N9PLH3_9HELO|nr:hypothetical protein HYFRA_00011061 [Hymenoscyphus fraxineus]
MDKVVQLLSHVRKAFTNQEGSKSPRLTISTESQGFKIAKDGTKIVNFLPLNIHDVLPPDHPRIGEYHEEAFFNIKGYSALEVSSFLKVQVENFPLSDALLSTLRTPISATKSDKDLLDLLQRWKEIFDEWFFARIMVGRYSLKFRHMDPSNAGQYDSTTSTIILNPSADLMLTDPHSTNSKEEFLIQTLLHEQVHAFIALSCCGKECCKQIYDNPSLGGPGEDGHGPVWADSMIILTDTLRKQSMAVGAWQPTVEQLKYWGVGVTREEVMYWSDIGKWDKRRLSILQHERKTEGIQPPGFKAQTRCFEVI